MASYNHYTVSGYLPPAPAPKSPREWAADILVGAALQFRQPELCGLARKSVTRALAERPSSEARLGELSWQLLPLELDLGV